MLDKDTDLVPGCFPEDLKWTAGNAAVSLEKLYGFVSQEGDRAVKWYFGKKRAKKILGYLFRVSTIIALTASGVIPIFGEICRTTNGPGISSLWSPVFLAVAAALVTLDRFCGWTSGWIRYVQVGQVLGRLTSEFRINWEKFRLALPDEQPDGDSLKLGIDLCRDFLARVHSAVSDETDRWAQDFQKVLLEVDGKTKQDLDRLTSTSWGSSESSHQEPDGTAH